METFGVQVAESVEERRLGPGKPTAGFAVGVVTQPAHPSDEAGARERASEQAALGAGDAAGALRERGTMCRRRSWSGRGHRSLVVGEHLMELQRRQREQRGPCFQDSMTRRNAIEGTHSDLVRAHGLRRARYRRLGRGRLEA